MSAQGGLRRRHTGAPLLRVEFLGGARAGQVVELSEGVHGLGSSRGARVQVPDDPDVAREHATLTVAPGAARLDDLRQGGTWLNGARLGGAANLAEGDLVRLGGTELRVAFLSPPEPATPDEEEPSVSGGPSSGAGGGFTAAPAGGGSAAAPAGGGSAADRREARRASEEAQRAARDARRAAAPERRLTPAGDEEPAGEARPYGNDLVALQLAQFFRRRPDLRFDFSLLGKERVHGYYYGDGAPTRQLTLGWRPLHVLYLMPHFPQLPPGSWPPSDRSGRLHDPGPHPQPEALPDGFRVDLSFNRMGEYYSYVAFRDLPRREGPPLRMPPPTR